MHLNGSFSPGSANYFRYSTLTTGQIRTRSHLDVVTTLNGTPSPPRWGVIAKCRLQRQTCQITIHSFNACIQYFLTIFKQMAKYLETVSTRASV